MSWRKIVPVCVVLLLTIPAFAQLPVASAQDTVPLTSNVPWSAQINHQTSLYLAYPDVAAPENPSNQEQEVPQPVCTSTMATIPPSFLTPVKRERRLENPRAPCSYTADVSGATALAQNEASFESAPVSRHFNLSGNDSLRYQHVGSIPSGLRMVVTVMADSRLIADATFDKNDTNQFDVEIKFDKRERVEVMKGERIRVIIHAFVNDPTAALAPPTWTVDDLGSRLIVRSSDTHRAATWTQDPLGIVRNLFRPHLDVNTTPREGVPRFVGYFAVQSAFGLDDASSINTIPEFVLERAGTSVPVGPEEDGVIPAEYNDSASQASEGRAVWNFQGGYLDYRGLQAGEYNLTVNMPYHQGSAFRSGATAKVLLSTQSVKLVPYDDEDPATFPSPLEALAHEMPPGGSTTFLFLVNNTGSVNDTFRLSTAIVSQTPSGWSASIGGADVLDNTVKLAPQESKLVTLTVAAPLAAGIDSSATVQLTAGSLVDPTARATSVPVIALITNTVRREVDVIVPSRTIDIIPGEDRIVPVYVWNRGTRLANISLEISTSGLPEWAEEFLVGDLAVKRLVLSNIRPGDVARADLRIGGPNNQPEVRRDLLLNATNLDVGGVSADRVLRMILKPTASVRVDVLREINGIGHYVEVTGSADGTVNQQSCVDGGDPTGQVCGPDDGIDGAWFRVWVTNTGRRADTFALSLEDIAATKVASLSSGVAPCNDQVFAPHTTGEHFGIFFRNPNGEASGRTQIRLQPGETGELYVWRSADRSKTPCAPEGSSDVFSFVVNAKGEATGAVGRSSASAIAMNAGGSDPHRTAVLIEGVARKPNYNSEAPLVDISQALAPVVRGGTEPGRNITYFVRVTHATSWATHEDRGRKAPDLTVSIGGVERDKGWNVSIRNVTTNPDPILFPYSDKIVMSNQFNQRREGWVDREIEVVVQPPSGENGTALAGEQNQFFLEAKIGSVSSTLSLKTVIVQFANITAETDTDRIFAHADEPSPYLLFINNTGSSNATVTLRAQMDPATTNNAPLWIVEPAIQQFPLQAFKNRTVALTVKPPAGAAPGTTGEVNVTIEYAPNPIDTTKTLNKTRSLITEVAGPSTLKLLAPTTQATTAPGGFANFTMSLSNTGSQAVQFRLTGTQLPNWTQTISPGEGTLAAGETRTVVYVLKAPADVVNNTPFSSIVRVVEIGNDANFDGEPVSINIAGGRPIPSLSVPKVIKTVDRAGAQNFEILVKNLGTAAGRILLSTRSADPAWSATVQTLRGDNVTFVDLNPNDAVLLNVSVRAPFLVPEHTIVPVEVIAENGGQTAKVALQAAVHDYGVHVELSPSRLDAIAGLPTEWIIKLRNDGNDNDTLNVSAILDDIPDWNVALATDRLRLEPGQIGEIRAIVKAPNNPLPIPRAYSLKLYASTVEGVKVNLTKNETVVGIVNVLNYRAADVDRDNFLEVAVDFDKNAANGFERFVEAFSEGAQSSVVATGRLSGKTNYFLDVPGDRPHDGLADVWYDPETVFTYELKFAPDVNGDDAPDYLLDTDHEGKIDKAFDTVSGAYWNVIEVKAASDETIQYLIDVTNDGRPDRFFDPQSKLVTRTQRIQGQDSLVGIDTTDDDRDRVDKYYDIRTNQVTDAKVYGFVDFAREYWYFFAGFLAMAILTIVVVVRRRSRNGDDE